MRLAVLLLLVCGQALAQALPSPILQPKDLRYCGPPKRDAQNRIVRSQKQRAAFIANVACPANDSHDGYAECPGWAVDHVWPLASCGCDAPVNMQWLPLAIKSCAGTACKDRWERKVYVCRPEDRL